MPKVLAVFAVLTTFTLALGTYMVMASETLPADLLVASLI
jgi:hypothetical protein